MEILQKAILDLLLNKPKSIPETIIKSKLPKATTYTRIRELIRDGLLTAVGNTKASDGRKVTQYSTTFNKVVFEIQNNDLRVNINIPKKFLRQFFI